jgi:hypothetical protein
LCCSFHYPVAYDIEIIASLGMILQFV